MNTKLDNYYAKLKKKARTINDLKALSNKNKASFEEAGIFLKVFKSNYIDFF